MKFKRFSDDNQRILEQAYENGYVYALVSKRGEFLNYHGLYAVACCISHLNTEEGEYEIVHIPDLKGFKA